MKRCITPAIIAVVVLAIQSAAHSAASADQGPFEPTSESLMHYQVPQWYDDAKFGIYFHWAPFSVRA